MQYMVAGGREEAEKEKRSRGNTYEASGQMVKVGGYTMVEWLNVDVFIMDWRCGKRCLKSEGRL